MGARQSGYTIAELGVAGAVGSLVLAIAMALAGGTRKAHQGLVRAGTAQQVLRESTELLKRGLSQSSPSHIQLWNRSDGNSVLQFDCAIGRSADTITWGALSEPIGTLVPTSKPLAGITIENADILWEGNAWSDDLDYITDTRKSGSTVAGCWERFFAVTRPGGETGPTCSLYRSLVWSNGKISSTDIICDSLLAGDPARPGFSVTQEGEMFRVVIRLGVGKNVHTIDFSVLPRN